MQMWDDGREPEEDYPNRLINYIRYSRDYQQPREIRRARWWIQEIRRSTENEVDSARGSGRAPFDLWDRGYEQSRLHEPSSREHRYLQESGLGSSTFSESEEDFSGPLRFAEDSDDSFDLWNRGSPRPSRPLREPGFGSSAFSDSGESDSPDMLRRWMQE